MLYVNNIIVKIKLTISAADKIFQGWQWEMKDYRLFPPKVFSKNQTAFYGWKITAPFRSKESQMLNNLVNLSKYGIIHKDLQSNTIKQDLRDIQLVIDLLQVTFINPVDESSLISCSVA